MAGFDDDVVGDHEGGVEAHTELADQFSVERLARSLQVLQERQRTRAGHRPDPLDQVVARHADAGVLDRQRPCLRVGREGDAERRVGVDHVAVGQHPEADLAERIRRVRDQLAQEDLRMGVERMDDEMQQLLHLGPILEDLWRSRLRGSGVFSHEEGVDVDEKGAGRCGVLYPTDRRLGSEHVVGHAGAWGPREISVYRLRYSNPRYSNPRCVSATIRPAPTRGPLRTAYCDLRKGASRTNYAVRTTQPRAGAPFGTTSSADDDTQRVYSTGSSLGASAVPHPFSHSPILPCRPLRSNRPPSTNA